MDVASALEWIEERACIIEFYDHVPRETAVKRAKQMLRDNYLRKTMACQKQP